MIKKLNTLLISYLLLLFCAFADVPEILIIPFGKYWTKTPSNVPSSE